MELISLERPERSLFWTAPVTDTGEMTTEDPLGLDYVAQQVGLLMLPTLTTRSTRAQAYAMVLYGLSLAEKAVDRFGYPNNDETKRQLFERWERFWALATLEYRGGNLPRGDWDNMRGVRGAKAAWKTGDGPLPLDFPLISRQQELGNLGAYLAPLRRAGLVADGSLKPTPGADKIVNNFWDEHGGNRHLGRYEEYAFAALDLNQKKIARKHDNGITLRRIGERSRLLSLVELRRKEQQQRLYSALFGNTQDGTTHAIASFVEAASKGGVREPRNMLTHTIEDQSAYMSSALRDLLITARAFGDYMQQLAGAFDRVYTTVEQGGRIASSDEVAAIAFGSDALANLRIASSNLLETPNVGEIRHFPMHGAACLRLSEDLRDVNAASTALELLLGYHATVQRDRRRAKGWLREEAGKLLLTVSSYTANPDTPRFPSFKLDVVRTLLTDTGQLPFDEVTMTPEMGS